MKFCVGVTPMDTSVIYEHLSQTRCNKQFKPLLSKMENLLFSRTYHIVCKNAVDMILEMIIVEQC